MTVSTGFDAGFRAAFRRLVGRDPSSSEIQHFTEMREIIRDAEIDPVLLVFLSDRRAMDDWERVPTAIRSELNAILKAIKSALPASGQLSQAITHSRSIDETFQRLEKGAAGVTRFVTLAVAFAVTLVVLSGGVIGYVCYHLGFDASDHRELISRVEYSCARFAEVRHTMVTRGVSTSDVDKMRAELGC